MNHSVRQMNVTTCEPKISDCWYTNLKLLGFDSSPHVKAVELCKSLFDHVNQKAFQHVILFLFATYDEKTKTEFRDCWPVLDKKQESEFRRKVVGFIKNFYKEFPGELPYTNPALFHTPGGRKFKEFLNLFSAFVLRMVLEKTYKVKAIPSRPTGPKSENHPLRLFYRNLVTKTSLALKTSVQHRTALIEVQSKSEQILKIISTSFFNKKCGVDLTSAPTQVFLTSPMSRLLELNSCVNKAASRIESLRREIFKAEVIFSNLRSRDETQSKVKLILNGLHMKGVDGVNQTRTTGSGSDLAIIGQPQPGSTPSSCIDQLTSQAARILNLQSQLRSPLDPGFSQRMKVAISCEQLYREQEVLKDLMDQSTGTTSDLLHQSDAVDWLNCYLTSTTNLRKNIDKTTLLPPTPSMLDKLTQKPLINGEEARRKIQLLTPNPSMRISVSPSNSSNLDFHKFAMENKNTGSSLRKHSLLKSTRLCTESPKPETKVADGKLSLNLNSTERLSARKTPEPLDISEILPGSSLPSVTPAKMKIADYKMVLAGNNNCSKPSLLSVWENHRTFLSPQSRKITTNSSPGSSFSSSPPSPPPIPGSVDAISSRLEDMMASLTMGDTSSDFDFTLENDGSCL